MSNTVVALDLKNKINTMGDDTIQMQQDAVKIYRGAAVVVKRKTGYATTLSTALLALVGGINYGVARFLGVAMQTQDNSAGAAGAVNINIARKGLFIFASSSITVADIGQKVWFSDDQTVTKTVPAAGTGGIYAGRVEAVDGDGVWVRIDDATVPMRKRVVTGQFQPTAAAPVATQSCKLYQCPAGAKAYIIALWQGYTTKPNFATTATLQVNKVVTGGTRTSVLSGGTAININNQAQAVDTPTSAALVATPATLELNPTDALEAQFATSGAQTASGDPYVTAEILELGGDND